MGDILAEVAEFFFERDAALRVEAVDRDLVEGGFSFNDSMGGVRFEAVVSEAETGGADEDLDGFVPPTSKGQEGGEWEWSFLPVVHEDGDGGCDGFSIADRRRMRKVREASWISWVVRFGRWVAISSTCSGVSARLRRT